MYTHMHSMYCYMYVYIAQSPAAMETKIGRGSNPATCTLGVGFAVEG